MTSEPAQHRASVEIGVCTPMPEIDLATQLVAAGARYYEPTVANDLMARDATAFDTTLNDWFGAGLSPRAANVFLPARLAIVGDVDWDSVEEYLAESFRRMVSLGIELVVFGSGNARRIPDGLDRPVALDQLERFTRLACAHAGTKVVVALEHLRRQETNVFNTLAESAAFLRDREIPGVGLVADVYHLWEEQEEISVIRRLSDLVVHVHVCAPNRRPPITSADRKVLDPFLAVLADVGYNRRCSLECSWRSPKTEGPLAVAILQEGLERAGLC